MLNYCWYTNGILKPYLYQATLVESKVPTQIKPY
jgi:hypothetical protein